ncbi:MAG: TusE/DsrC/DsvC family sulfur relay protein [Gammaproteobacteria bacterium]|nr:TusE/DsrC/DsvC family sulfur relay protein [Gammaproteobacteria bacterium]MCB1818721.1 TusE/DsrC/DsvC family sulfur relay protein [Gammaproteobacteria bacterium]MCP5316437.1 TusE/DsrC/DsvC family sulfur relay protein [Chromatiaceae bacterium]HPQ26244.1 TusE/DsrC/DsvC family sulfur relay protein [Gammaproteobacteria bacterium]
MRMEKATGRDADLKVPEHAVLEVDGRFVRMDLEGYLVDPADWSKAVAERMAEVDGLELVDDHWLLIDFLNRFYAEYQIAPELPVLARNLCKDQNDCRWTRRYIKELFPGGAKTACRYAGLPAPVGRSCG